jgi:hypothetical protein
MRSRSQLKTGHLRAGIVLAIFCALAPSALPADQGEAGPYEGRIIDEIRVVGAGHTREYIITRELASRPGQPLTSVNLGKDRESLDGLGVFSQIKLDPVEEGEKLVLQV